MIKNQTIGVEPDSRLPSDHPGKGPFSPRHDILCFYGGAGRSQIMDGIVRHLKTSDDVVVVAGDSGSGKTLLSLVLSNALARKFSIVRYDEPRLVVGDLLGRLCGSFKAQQARVFDANSSEQLTDDAVSISTRMQQLRAMIKSLPASTPPTVLLIDTARPMSQRELLFLHELTQLSLNKKPIIKLVLFVLKPIQTDNSLPARLMEFVENSLSVDHVLHPLTLDETHDYLHQQMLLFDYHKRYAFSRDISFHIAERAAGNLRRINELAHGALQASEQGDMTPSMSYLLKADAVAPGDGRQIRTRASARTRLCASVFAGGLVVMLSVFMWLGR